MDLDLSRPELPSNYTFYTESASIGIFLVIGLIANIPLVLVYIKSKHNRSVADKFLLNILIVDVLSLVILLPTILMDLVLNHREESISSVDIVRESVSSSSADFPSTWSCTFKKSFLSGIATASILAALEIAVERYLVIVTPLHYHKLLTRPAVIITSAFGVLIAIGSAVLSSLDPCEPVFPSCAKTTVTYADSLWWPTYTLIHVSVFFILPVFLMAFIYSRIWCEARRQISKINEQCKNPFFLSDHHQIHEHSENGKRRIKLYPLVLRTKIMNRLKAARTDKAARASICTLGTTIICWSPYYYVQCAHAIRSIMEQMGGNFKVLEAWNHWETTVPLLFASLHPVLESFFYAYRYKRLRDEVKKILHIDTLISYCFFRPHHRRDGSLIEKCPNVIQVTALTGYGTTQTLDFEDCCAAKPISWTAAATGPPDCVWAEERPRFQIGDFGIGNETGQDYGESCFAIPNGSCDGLPVSDQHIIDAVNETPSEKCGTCPENGSCDVGVNLDSRMTQRTRLKAAVYWMGRAAREFLNSTRDWSKRWMSHRESVTSTSSVVTLISSRWRSEMPVDDV